MKYYKITHGYKKEDVIRIDETELEKALYIHITKKDGIFKNGGSISGQYIQTIKPDYNRTMGWNEAHQLDDFDFMEIRQKLGNTLENRIAEAKERIDYFMRTKQENLIGTNAEIKKLESPLSPEIKALAESKRI